MKRTIIATLLMIAAIAISCTPKEEAKPVKSGLANDGSIVANPTATIADFIMEGATKTVLAIDEETGATFTFANDDILGVFPYDPQQGDQVRFTVKAQDASSCTFNGSGYALESGQLYAAYYPGDLANAASEMMTKIPVDYTGQAQAAAGAFNISDVDYLVANGIEPANGVCDFQMQHVGALLVMDVTFAEAGTFTELSLTSDATPFVQKGTLDLTQDEIKVTSTQAGAAMTLALGEGSGLAVTADQTVRFCMMIAPVNFKEPASNLTLSLKDAEENEISASIPAKNFKAGFAYKIAATPGAAAAEAINLSENGTANSYIVSAAGDYCFDATVAGNGTAGVVSFPSAWVAQELAPTHNDYPARVYPTSGASLSEGKSAYLHWAQNECIKDVTLVDGKIYFKATGAKGNAKISLYGQHPAKRWEEDGYIWTWIIWCTDAPGTITYSTPASPSNTFTVMDRNLGAITNAPIASGHSAEEMSGLYYQWGNPIGFTSTEYLRQTTNSAWRMVDALMSPNKPLINSDYQWFSPFGTDQGGAVYSLLWGSGEQSNFLDVWPAASFYKKTIYDPCPAGYKVAPVDFLRGYTDTNDHSVLTADCFGMYLQGDDGTIFFPYTGSIWTNYWHSNPFSFPEGDNGYAMRYWTSGSSGQGNRGSNYAWYFTGGQRNETRVSYLNVTTDLVSRGMAVRCVVE